MKKFEVIAGKVKVDGKVVPNAARWSCNVDPSNGLTLVTLYVYQGGYDPRTLDRKTVVSHRGYPATITIKQETP